MRDMSSENLRKRVLQLAISRTGLSLTEPLCGLPIHEVNFILDAAGAVLSWSQGITKKPCQLSERGLASFGYSEQGLFYSGGLNLPFHLESRQRETFRRKSTHLESVCLLLPLSQFQP